MGGGPWALDDLLSVAALEAPVIRCRQRQKLPRPQHHRRDPPALVAEAEDDRAGGAGAADGEDAGHVELPPPQILARA